jgi:glutamine synthetase adenylyltransferase
MTCTKWRECVSNHVVAVRAYSQAVEDLAAVTEGQFNLAWERCERGKRLTHLVRPCWNTSTSTDAWARTPQLRLRERRILADVGESEVVRVPGNLSHLGMHDGEYASRKA